MNPSSISGRQIVEISSPSSCNAEQTASPEKNACLLCGAALEAILTGLSDNRLGTPGTLSSQMYRMRPEQTSPMPTFAELKNLYEVHYNFGGEKGTVYMVSGNGSCAPPVYAFGCCSTETTHSLRAGARGVCSTWDVTKGGALRLFDATDSQAEGLDLNP